MKKCLPANSARPSEDRLTTVQFHPSAQVVMTAGLDQSVSLFQVHAANHLSVTSSDGTRRQVDMVWLHVLSHRWTGRRTRRSRASTWTGSPSTRLSSARTERRWSPPAWRTRCSTCTTWWRAGSHLCTRSEVSRGSGVRRRAGRHVSVLHREAVLLISQLGWSMIGSVWSEWFCLCAGLNEARVKEFSVCPEGGALLLTGTNGYLHLLTLKVTLLLLLLLLLFLGSPRPPVVCCRCWQKYSNRKFLLLLCVCVCVCVCRLRRWFAVWR